MRSLEPQEATILVVDDDCDVRDALRDVLADSGFGVACVGNGDEALAYLQRHARPVAILLDLFMPVINGWEFVRRIRGTRFGSIPIVAITGAEPHWGTPVSRVLRKPITPEELLAALGEALSNPTAGSSEVVSLA